MEEGEKTPMPHFAGQRGPEIIRGLLEIETVFEKNLNMLRNVKKTILDVKATSWHDDYNRYCQYVLVLGVGGDPIIPINFKILLIFHQVRNMFI